VLFTVIGWALYAIAFWIYERCIGNGFCLSFAIGCLISCVFSLSDPEISDQVSVFICSGSGIFVLDRLHKKKHHR
jgi:hypothetical protein